MTDGPERTSRVVAAFENREKWADLLVVDGGTLVSP
jgi:hypothetical protein